ncbi:sensor histidine kinase, partial [Pseudoxanthomonas sp. SGD-10]
ITLNEVVQIIRESQQLITLNKELQEKSLELKRASEALAHANKQMKDAEVLKDEFLYTITHELRTPLTSIRAFSEILFDNPSIKEEQRQQFLATMIKEIERLSKLITRVLDLEKLESGRQSLNLRSINVKDLIEDSIVALAPLIEEHKVELVKNFHDTNLQIAVDRDLVSRVIHNLVSNAIKYADEEIPRIEISFKATGDLLQVRVADNGVGIEDRHKLIVFNKFYQIHMPKKHEGTGLGLAICKKIIELHEGKIWVEDVPSGGACFVFTLSLTRDI